MTAAYAILDEVTSTAMKGYRMLDGSAYITVQTAVRAMDDFTVPDPEIDAYIQQNIGGPAAGLLGFIRLRCVLEFAERLSHTVGGERTALFTYSHDSSGDSDDPFSLAGPEDIDGLHRSPGHKIAPLDIVIVRMISFNASKQDFPMVMSKFAEKGAMIFVSQAGFSNELPTSSFLKLLTSQGHSYTKLNDQLLDGLFRPRLPTPTGTIE